VRSVSGYQEVFCLERNQITFVFRLTPKKVNTRGHFPMHLFRNARNPSGQKQEKHPRTVELVSSCNCQMQSILYLINFRNASQPFAFHFFDHERLANEINVSEQC
jgi:hypothetical protein